MFDRNYIYPLKSDNTSTWAYLTNYFTKDECARIIQLGQELVGIEANLGFEHQTDNEIRKTTVAFFDPKQGSVQWIFDRIKTISQSINQQFWNFDLRFIECIQFTQYNKSGDFYTSHMDMRYNSIEVRKLSISVQLSDSDDYNGCDLELLTYGNNSFAAPRAQGTVIAFPSYHLHRVTPLVSGTRYSLVAWIVGPPFR